MVGFRVLKVKQMETLIQEVFETVLSMKRAYVRLQEAHSPWDPEKMRDADVAVVSELRKLVVLKERCRRNGGGGKRSGRRTGSGGGVGSLREVVAPYEAVVEELKKEVKTKDLEKLESAVALSNNSSGEKKPGRSQSKRKLGIQAIAAAPTPELFEATMVQVRESSKSFTSLLLSLMHNPHRDITAAVTLLIRINIGEGRNSKNDQHIFS